ncbi:MAG: DUF1207 domain-containing protein [Myxococcales bacterium]|nr:DUF1207 domain-containing protein [Myxococcales bacterium]
MYARRARPHAASPGEPPLSVSTFHRAGAYAARPVPALLAPLLLVGLALAPATGRADAAPEPDWVLGYAEGALETAYSLEAFGLEYHDGLLALDVAERPPTPLDALLRLMLDIDGVTRATIAIDGTVVARATRPADLPAEADRPTEADAPAEAAGEAPDETSASGRDAPGRTESATATDSPIANGRRGGDGDRYDILSIHELFDPLLADPRWPRFEFAHLWYLGDPELERVGSVSFGESLAIVRSPRRDWGRLELGVQGGVFSVFDLEAPSQDLVNSDFVGGLTLTHHLGDVTSILRLYHQSSHLGDEYLLRTGVDRVGLSFEVLDLLVAYQMGRWGRIYGGGGVMVHRSPALERGIVQMGIELTSPLAFAGGHLRPVAALDHQVRAESDWRSDFSFVGGVQVEHPTLRRTRLRLLLTAYSGRSPNGQFYERRIDTIGLGLQLQL